MSIVGFPGELQDRIGLARSHQQPSILKAVVFLVEFLSYALFTVSLIVCALQDRYAQDTHLMYVSTQQAIIPTQDTFGNIRNPHDAMMYISDSIASVVLMDTLAPSGYKLTNASNLDNFVLNSLTLMSTVRVRQFRVKTGCDLVGNTELLNLCIPPMSSDVIDRSSFLGTASGTTYNYTHSASPSSKVSGKIDGVEYPLWGHQVEYVVDPIRRALTAANLSVITLDAVRDIVSSVYTSQWIQDDWVGPSTRALFAEFSLMLNHGPHPTYGAAIVIFEFPPAGGCVSSFQMVPFSPGSSMTVAHILCIVSLGVVVVRRLIKIGMAAVEQHRHRGGGGTCCKCLQWSHFDELIDQRWYTCQHCKASFDRLTCDRECPECERAVEHWTHTCVRYNVLSVWTVMLAVHVLLIILNETENTKIRSDVSDLVSTLNTWVANTNGNQDVPPYINFLPLQIEFSVAMAMESINVVLASFGIFNYLLHFEVFQKFLRLFSAGAYLLLAFTLTFSIPFIGFAVATQAVVGAYTDGFQTLQGAIIQTFGMLKGDVQLKDMNSETQWLMIVLYIVFGVLFVFIALNVFISIVSQSYEIAIQSTPDDVYINSLLMLKSKIITSLHLHRAVSLNPKYLDEKRKSKTEMKRILSIRRNKVHRNSVVQLLSASNAHRRSTSSGVASNASAKSQRNNSTFAEGEQAASSIPVSPMLVDGAGGESPFTPRQEILLCKEVGVQTLLLFGADNHNTEVGTAPAVSLHVPVTHVN